MALAVINAQIYVYNQLELPVADDLAGYGGMFYAVTGAMMVLFIAGFVVHAGDRLPGPRWSRP